MNRSDIPYTLVFEQRQKYLFVIVRAESMDRKMALTYLSEIADRCREYKAKRLIIQRDVPVMLPVADLFFTTDAFLRMMGGVRVAFLNPHATIADQMDFAILIGTNRGAEFSVHNTYEAAEEWLFDR